MHISMLALHLGVLLTLLTFPVQGLKYHLRDHFNRTNFFSEFDFFSAPDPTHGFVQYVDAMTANNEGLAGYSGPDYSSIYLGVDYRTPKALSPGRKSVRVESKKTWTRGLFIVDLNHMPAPVCGAWPAFWLFCGNWPVNGEIDVLEGVNQGQTNSVTLHTSKGCTVGNDGILTKTGSTLMKDDCAAGSSFLGCGYKTESKKNYGAQFNNLGGGQFIMEWTSEMIRVWSFTRSQIPPNWLTDLDLSLDPDLWSPPIAVFNGKSAAGGNCAIDKHFKNHRMVFNTAFCGDWAGNTDVWNLPGPGGPQDSCGAKAKTCEEYVAENGAVFQDSFWEINDVRVYETETQPDPVPGPSGPAALPKLKRRTPSTWVA